MKNYIIFLTVLLIPFLSTSQIISFTDLELKRFLLNEKSVDTNFNGTNLVGKAKIDVNNDGNIQLSEIVNIKSLAINNFGKNYNIKSISDLNQFSHLNHLSILSLDSLLKIENMVLDSLSYLFLNSCTNLKKVDVSSLNHLTEVLRIEDMVNIDTLNLSNGNSARVFSLFYTQNVEYACIDSIQSEIQEVINSAVMKTGYNYTFNCNLTSLNRLEKEKISIYPNPATDIIHITSSLVNPTFVLYTIEGKKILTTKENYLDVSSLKSGLYIVKIISQTNTLSSKISIL